MENGLTTTLIPRRARARTVDPPSPEGLRSGRAPPVPECSLCVPVGSVRLCLPFVSGAARKQLRWRKLQPDRFSVQHATPVFVGGGRRPTRIPTDAGTVKWPGSLQCVASFILALGGVTCAPRLGAQVTPPEQFQVREVWSTEGKEIADGITSIGGLVETADGMVWMADLWGAAGRVLVLDPATMEANVVGRPGDGPGEVRIPLHMTVTPGGGVAVLDGGRNAIEIYGASGQPVQRVQLREPIVGHKGFTALAGGGFIITGYLAGSGAAVHYFDADGVRGAGWREHPAVPGAPAPGSPWRNNLERDAAMAQLAVTGGWVHGLPDGSFLYSQAAPHEIVLFERSPTRGNGWVERPLVRMPSLFDAPGMRALEYTTGDDGQTSVGYDMTWPRSRSVFGMSNGYILNVVIMEGEGQTRFQVFDQQGAGDGTRAVLVADALVDRLYRTWFLSENDDVLAHVNNPVTEADYAVRLRLSGIPGRTDRQQLGAREGRTRSRPTPVGSPVRHVFPAYLRVVEAGNVPVKAADCAVAERHRPVA